MCITSKQRYLDSQICYSNTYFLLLLYYDFFLFIFFFFSFLTSNTTNKMNNLQHSHTAATESRVCKSNVTRFPAKAESQFDWLHQLRPRRNLRNDRRRQPAHFGALEPDRRLGHGRDSDGGRLRLCQWHSATHYPSRARIHWR